MKLHSAVKRWAKFALTPTFSSVDLTNNMNNNNNNNNPSVIIRRTIGYQITITAEHSKNWSVSEIKELCQKRLPKMYFLNN